MGFRNWSVLAVFTLSVVILCIRTPVPALRWTHLATFFGGVFVLPISKLALTRLSRAKSLDKEEEGSESAIYGLDHARLHINPETPMWMNMGYWKVEKKRDPWYTQSATHRHVTLAVASRALLSEVLKTAGFTKKQEGPPHFPRRYPPRALLDLGFGCGDQTVYLMGRSLTRSTDWDWWDSQDYVPRFNSYVGITLDRKQYHYAQKRVQELERRKELDRHSIHGPCGVGSYNRTEGLTTPRLFCADAARPEEWDNDLRRHIHTVFEECEDPWVLALDTLYHFSPSRWPIINYASQNLKASFMAFDLCIADKVSLWNIILLRILTTLMGAPWANFVTQDQYRAKLLAAGYKDIVVKDVSGNVFGPLATFLEEQDRRLRIFGFGLGSFHLARWMFGWWARTGVIRGVIFVAMHERPSGPTASDEESEYYPDEAETLRILEEHYTEVSSDRSSFEAENEDAETDGDL